MFASQRPKIPNKITVENTKKFLMDQMSLIAEAKGADPESLPLRANESYEYNMVAIANMIKCTTMENQTITALHITRENAKTTSEEIVSENLNAVKEGQYHIFLFSVLRLTYCSFITTSNNEIQYEFINHLAISLHESTKDLVANNSNWVDRFIEEADKQSIKNWVKANLKGVKEVNKYLPTLCVLGIGLFFTYQCIKNGEIPPVIRNSLGM